VLEISSGFEFEGKSIRMVGTPDHPEWVAKDVCDVLGLDQVTKALRGLDPDEVASTICTTQRGQAREMLTVTEPGLYRLLGRSRKQIARRFMRWVNHEVLPSIRRTGAYTVGQREGDSPIQAVSDHSATLIVNKLEEAIAQHAQTQAAQHAQTQAAVGYLADQVKQVVRRKDLTAGTMRRHVAVVVRLGGYCPACWRYKVVTEDGLKSTTAEWDHFHAPHRASVKETWLVCRPCNQKFKDPAARDLSTFLEYQKTREKVEANGSVVHPAAPLAPYRGLSVGIPGGVKQIGIFGTI